MERAESSKEVLKKRFDIIGFKPKELRWDYIGMNSVQREITSVAKQLVNP